MKLFRINAARNQCKKKQAHGFSLLEVLISVLILSIGLLGIAALHATSLKANHGAYHKSQATFLAYDIVDRMRANRPNAINDSYDILITDPIPTGSTLAITDVSNWLTNLAALLPSGDGSIACDPAGRCTVIVQWDVSREGGTAVAVPDGGSTTLQLFRVDTDV